MRTLALMTLLLAAGCAEDSGNKAAPKETATRLQAGQWEATTEVTRFEATDGPPAISAAVGTRTTASVCVGPEDRPPAELFSGAGYTCEYDNHYMRHGTLNAGLSCTRPGVSGQIMMSVTGSYTDTTLDGEVEVTTYISGPGDVSMAGNLTARRTGDCTSAE